MEVQCSMTLFTYTLKFTFVYILYVWLHLCEPVLSLFSTTSVNLNCLCSIPSPDPTFTCNDGDLRLRDGETDFEGRVEICRDNHFGTVCALGWDENDAQVACRQLGFPEESELTCWTGSTGFNCIAKKYCIFRF